MSDRIDVHDAIVAAAQVHQVDFWGDYPYISLLAMAANDSANLMAAAGHPSIYDHEDVVAISWLRAVVSSNPDNLEALQEKFPTLLPVLYLLAAARRTDYDALIEDLLAGEGDSSIALIVELAWARVVVRLGAGDTALMEDGIAKMARALASISR